MHVKWLGSGESVSLECDRQYLMSCGLKAQHSPYCNYCNYHPPPSPMAQAKILHSQNGFPLFQLFRHRKTVPQGPTSKAVVQPWQSIFFGSEIQYPWSPLSTPHTKYIMAGLH